MEAYEENLGAVGVAEEPVAEPIKQEMTESETIKEEVESIQDIREPENVSIEKRWPGWPGDSVFRILVPGQKVGGIIGRKGEFIKKMCEETRARIKILDGPPGIQERAVLISAKEEHDTAISPAMDGLLSVHKRSVDGLEGDFSKIPQNTENVIITRLLVPASQAGSLIGKHGATIKYIQEASSCAVRILEDFCAFSLPDDRMVEVQGEPAGVHKAVELIAGQLRKFLVDRTVLPLFEMYHIPMQNAHMEHNMPPPHNMPPHNMSLPPPQPWSHPQGSSSFGGNPSFMPPRQPHDNFYPPSDMRSMEKEPQHGVSAHAREHPSHLGGLSADQQGVTSQVTHNIQIQLSYADAVIGAAGANISYIRRASGATITIQETRGVPAEMTVEINGSATQVQTAQQLIQNFIAEAGAPTRNPAPSTDQGYSSYQNQGSNSYMSPANPVPPRPSPGGYGYASGYGTNYGY